MAIKDKRFEFRFWVIEPQLGLHEHATFWLPVLIFLGCGLFLSLPLWCFCIPNVADYEQIMKDAAYPIFVASLAIPFGVMIGRFHGSAQRKLANDLSNTGMSFNRFYDHRKHFYDFLRENYKPPQRVAKAVFVSKKATFYRFLFPANSPELNNFEMDDEAFRAKAERTREKIEASIANFQGKYISESEVSPGDALNFASEILNHFGLSITDNFQDEFSDTDESSIFEFLLLCIKDSLREGFQFAETDSMSKLGWYFHLSIDDCFSGYKTDKKAIELNNKLVKAISLY